MHGLIRKIAVFASLDVKQHNQRATSSLLINYSTKEIAPLSFTSHFDTTSCEVLEAHGIIGNANIAVGLEMLGSSFSYRVFRSGCNMLCHFHLSTPSSCAD